MNKLNSQDLCFALRKCYNIVSNFYNNKLMSLGITFAQLSLMMEVEENENFTLTALSYLVGIDRTSINRNVKVLVNYGYIKDYVHKDKRCKFLKLTEEGRAMMKEGVKILGAIQKEVANNIESLIKPEVLCKDLGNVSESIRAWG